MMNETIDMTIYVFKNNTTNKTLFAAFSDESIIADFMIKMEFDSFRKLGKKVNKEVEYE